jgi:hypothetical protein
MSEIETETTPEIDPIEDIFQGECLSLSGLATLQFKLGKHSENGTLWLAISGSSGNGMVSKDWVAASQLNEIVIGETALTGKAFQAAQPGRSINFGPFAKAICMELQFIEASPSNGRVAHHIPGTTFEKVAMAYIAAHEAAPKAGRTRSKEG